MGRVKRTADVPIAQPKSFREGDRVLLAHDADGYLTKRLGLVVGRSLGTVADMRPVSPGPIDSCMVKWDDERPIDGTAGDDNTWRGIRCGFEEIEKAPQERNATMAQKNYKIVPLDADSKTTTQKAQELREYLAANVAVHLHDGELEKAAVFQQHLDTLDVLIEHSRDRVS